MLKNSFLKHRFASMTLRSRLLLYFVLVSIIPVLLIGVVSYTVSVNIVKEKAMQFSNQMIGQVTGEIDTLLLDAYKVSMMVAEEPTIQVVLRKPLNENIAQRYSTDLMMDTRLNFIQSSYRNEFFGFYVIGANGGKYKSNFYSVKEYELRDMDWYRKTINSNEPVWFSTHTGSYAVETIGERLISVGFPIIDKATGKKLGIVLIDMEEELLSQTAGSRLGKTGYMVILDKNNRVISHPHKSLISQTILISEMAAKGMGSYVENSFETKTVGRAIVISKTSPVSGWKIIGVLPMSELTKDSRMVGYIIAGMLMIICFLALITAWAVAGSIANPIKKLMFLMRQVEEGNFSVTMKVKYDDEIGKLGKSFNVMIEEIGKLMDKVYQEQKELRKAELKALQAQINPHFLYNTLDSIIWMSRAKRNEDVISMVTALTKLFRIAISKGKDIITIQEEIEHIHSYLIIQQIRYKNKLSFRINVPDFLAKFETLKLILQPIVENAIYHGIKKKREPGMIEVTAREEKNHIIFEINDTGIGMTKEELLALENTLRNTQGEKMESYGLKNVDERIKIFFGPDCGLTFDSQYGVGTKVEIKIPKIPEVGENVKSSLGG
jgi:two-component system, sensor histidine kinase YesM